MSAAWGDGVKSYVASGCTGETTLKLGADGLSKLSEVNAWLAYPDPDAKRPEWMGELLPPQYPKGAA